MLDAAIFFIADFLISAYITPKEEKKGLQKQLATKM
jgi:hypothetical protein